MQAVLEALEDGLVTPEATTPVLREQVALLTSLVDDLFELARIDAGALTLELRDALLEPVVGSCLRGVEADARRRGIGLAATVADDVSARCAPEKVERVLFNLLTNALRHTPADGSVAVRVEQVDREVHVTVEDTGEGLDEDARRAPRRVNAPVSLSAADELAAGARRSVRIDQSGGLCSNLNPFHSRRDDSTSTIPAQAAPGEDPPESGRASR